MMMLQLTLQSVWSIIYTCRLIEGVTRLIKKKKKKEKRCFKVRELVEKRIQIDQDFSCTRGESAVWMIDYKHISCTSRLEL